MRCTIQGMLKLAPVVMAAVLGACTAHAGQKFCVFDFLGTNFFDLSAGESALEPIQLAVRSVIERAALEMVTRIYRIPPGSACASPLNTAADPLGDRPYPARAANPPYAADRPATYSMESSNDPRQNPYRGYSSSDTVGDVRLRGRY